VDPIFRAAIGISIALHSALIAPLLTVERQHEKLREKRELVVDYVAMKEVPARTTAKPVMRRETPKVEITKKADVKPAAPQKTAPAKDDPAKKKAAANARAQARIRSTKDYINYYQLIRGKIRDRLMIHYRKYFAEGEVALAFVLTEKGELESSAIDELRSSPNTTLHDIALRSLREAAPFPPFPKALTLPRMTFTLQVAFKRE